jgi:hypothetical protein
VFLTLTVIGLVGLLMMAIPAFGRHGHAQPAPHGHGHPGAGHALGHGAHGAHGAGLAAPRPAATAMSTPAPATQQQQVPADTAPTGFLRFVPSPRAVFTVLALYGASGNVLVEVAHLGLALSAVLAVVPALAIERILVRPLWNLLFRFQGAPSSPLDALLYADAEAVVPFRNGRGLVAVQRDGRVIQLSARLRADQARLPVKVGERLRIDDVDARRERVIVSVFRD